jgi:hypothetical protein
MVMLEDGWAQCLLSAMWAGERAGRANGLIPRIARRTDSEAGHSAGHFPIDPKGARGS